MMDSDDMFAEVCVDLRHLDPGHLAKVSKCVAHLIKRATAAVEIKRAAAAADASLAEEKKKSEDNRRAALYAQISALVPLIPPDLPPEYLRMGQEVAHARRKALAAAVLAWLLCDMLRRHSGPTLAARPTLRWTSDLRSCHFRQVVVALS